MKLKHLIGLTILAGAGYSIYRNRQTIAEKITDTKETIAQGQATLGDIQNQAQSLTQALPELQKLSDNLSYKLRVFEQESKPHLEAIQEILGKYQNKKPFED